MALDFKRWQRRTSDRFAITLWKSAGPEQEQLYLDSLWSKFEEIFAAPREMAKTSRSFFELPNRRARKACHSLPYRGRNAPNRTDTAQFNGSAAAYSRNL